MICLPARTRLRDVRAVLFGCAEAAFLSRPIQPPQRPPDRPGSHPHASFLGQAIAALRQGQMVIRFQQAP